MSIVRITPENAKSVLRDLSPGTEVIFSPGEYRQKLKIKLKNDPESPLTVLRGEPGAIISAGVSADEFREKGNQIAKCVQEGDIPTENKYPGLYPHKMHGHFKIYKSANILIEGLKFEKSWPTHIAIKNCQNLSFRNCEFLDATFAIAAEGKRTYGLRFEHCSWLQDRIPGRMWKEIPWGSIHGDHRDDGGKKYGKVDIKNDWRMFDGDFLRAENIAGGITLEYCSIGQAFNAIHLYNPKKKLKRSVDVNVNHCHFFEIRDNVLEPEGCAYNWWFWNNTIKNAHKPFSLNITKGGAFYLFGNRWWFDSVQGPANPVESRIGGMFKFHSSGKQEKLAPNYVFHNSIATRGDYARKGTFSELKHLNNAIWSIQEGLGYDDFIKRREPTFFGKLSELPSNPKYVKNRFTLAWKDEHICFVNDVIFDRDWPEELLKAGYNGVTASYAKDPEFSDILSGDFTLSPSSPCRQSSADEMIQMPVGEDWCLRGGQDIGALQEEVLFKGPEFRPTYKGLRK